MAVNIPKRGILFNLNGRWNAFADLKGCVSILLKYLLNASSYSSSAEIPPGRKKGMLSATGNPTFFEINQQKGFSGNSNAPVPSVRM